MLGLYEVLVEQPVALSFTCPTCAHICCTATCAHICCTHSALVELGAPPFDLLFYKPVQVQTSDSTKRGLPTGSRSKEDCDRVFEAGDPDLAKALSYPSVGAPSNKLKSG